MKEAKTIFEKLKADVNIVLFREEKINNNFFKRLKKSSYAEVDFSVDFSVGKF